MHTSCVLLASGLISYAVAQDCSKVCESSGTDFVDGGSYFQDSNSASPFTAYEEFSGCQNDTANNILVSPSGNQYECNNTPMTPDDTDQLVTCPIDKNQLYSGNWTIIVISNNGECQPIDYMRQFYISAGPQQTSTTVTTTTVTTTSTPVSTTLVTSTSIVTSQAPPVTTTVTTGTQSTFTRRPAPAFVYTTKGVITITRTSTTAPVVATSSVTKTTCLATTAKADPLNSVIAVTVGPQSIQSLASSLLHEFPAFGGIHPRVTPIARSGGAVSERQIIEEIAPAPKMGIMKRHPDAATTIVTSTSTVMQTSAAPTITATGTTTVLQTTTTTSTVTVVSGQGMPATVTAPRQTSTIYFYVPIQTTQTTVTHPVTSTTTTIITSC